MDIELQVGSCESGAEGQNLLPHPADHAALHAARDIFGFLGCEHTRLAHIQPLITPKPFPSGLLPVYSPPSPWLCLGFLMQEYYQLEKLSDGISHQQMNYNTWKA